MKPQTLFTPADDGVSALLMVLRSATRQLRVCIFTLTLQIVVDLLIAKHQAGVDVALILDKTQVAFAAEGRHIAALQAAGVPLRIGTSPKAHTIIHAKYVVADNTVLDGSMNFTTLGNEEVNVINIATSMKRARQFRAAFDALWQWLSANAPPPAAAVHAHDWEGVSVSFPDGPVRVFCRHCGEPYPPPRVGEEGEV